MDDSGTSLTVGIVAGVVIFVLLSALLLHLYNCKRGGLQFSDYVLAARSYFRRDRPIFRKREDDPLAEEWISMEGVPPPPYEPPPYEPPVSYESAGVEGREERERERRERERERELRERDLGN